ncbi:MAG: 3-hydroxyacyl-CoA dehydrogenase [Syntrophomonadaceae bacterium]|nr:3-hydroxyacyl-CoA dehydrogenase [Syntrophomonadaceae bacterium]
MQASDIKKVLIIGSGTMGRHIGLQNALFGCDVVLYDLNEDALKTAVVHIGKIAGGFVKGGYITEEMASAALARISTSSDPAQASEGIDLVSESIPENVELKKKVWGEFSKYLPKDAILTTNTSTLLPSLFAEASGKPERFLAWHFNLPVFIANIVDVMPHAGTDPSVTQLMVDYSKRVGLIPIFIEQEWARYVFNEMFTTLQSSAQRLAVNKVASIEDIDRCWMVILNAPFGPFAIMDNIGIDTNLNILKEAVAADPDVPYGKEVIAFLQAKVDAGELGRKTGKGFYTYPNPAYEQPDFVERVVPKYKK